MTIPNGSSLFFNEVTLCYTVFLAATMLTHAYRPNHMVLFFFGPKIWRPVWTESMIWVLSLSGISLNSFKRAGEQKVRIGHDTLPLLDAPENRGKPGVVPCVRDAKSPTFPCTIINAIERVVLITLVSPNSRAEINEITLPLFFKAIKTPRWIINSCIWIIKKRKIYFNPDLAGF